MPVPVFVPDEVVTAARLNALPKGVLGYAQVTANQATISAETDLTGLTVTVTAEASRRIRVACQIQVAGTTNDNSFALLIKEGATGLQAIRGTCPRSATGENARGEIIITPTAGSHTYKLTLQMTAGTGTVGTTGSAATSPQMIWVEDVGAV